MTIRTMSVAVCTLFVFLLVPASPAQAATHVEIAVDQLNIRSTPGTDNPIIGTLAKGMRLSILAQQKDWTKVKLANGQEGWVHSKYVKMIEIPRTIYVKSNVAMLNVRAEPNATAQIVQIIDENGVFLQLAKQGNWAKIKLSDDRSGWVNARYLAETAAPAPATAVGAGQAAGSLASPQGNDGFADLSGIPAPQAPIETFIRVKNPDTNLRSGPGTNYPVVGIVQPGHMFPIVQTEGEWYLIQLPDQSFAYIASWIVDRVLPDGSQMLGGADSLGIDWGHGMTGSETVYIYHTHNRESWRNVASHTNGNSVDDPAINITLVGKRLGELLQERGIQTKVNQDDFARRLAEQKKSFAMSYTESYKAVLAAATASPNLTYIFDIHRDGDEPRSKVAHTINGKTYARILFVIGTANPNYQENKKRAEQLHARLETAYPGLSRGIILKGKSDGNGEYNQSVHEGSLLLEIGGTNNTLEECYHTAEALADVLVHHILESQIAFKQ